MSKVIYEIGVEASEQELADLECALKSCGIAYYIEPTPKVPYESLAELEADCEGK